VDKLIEYLNDRFPGRDFTMIDGKKYAKIVQGNSSAYCFVAKGNFTTKGLGTVFNGDLLKPASWKVPAKHARGNLYDEASWDKAFGKYGMHYLKYV